MEQDFSVFAGRTVTLSALLHDKGVVFQSVKMPTAKPTQWTNFINVVDDSYFIQFNYDASIDKMFYEIINRGIGEVRPIAAKLELGDHQTLAHQDADGNWVLNEIPDYGEQLRQCQRYCFSPTFGAKPSYASFGIGRGNDSGDGAYIQIPTPVSMRDIPVIVNKENLYMNGAAVTDISVEAVSASAITVNVKANIQTTPTGCYSLQMSNGANLLFLAGL